METAAGDGAGAMTWDKIVVNLLGLALIAFIVWFFWLVKAKGMKASLTSSGYQEQMVLVKGGYTPDVIVVERDKPVRLNFVRQESASCSEMLLLPAFNKRMRIRLRLERPTRWRVPSGSRCDGRGRVICPVSVCVKVSFWTLKSPSAPPPAFETLSSNPIAHVIRFKVCRRRGAQYKTSPRFLRRPLSLSFAKWSPRTGIMDFIFSFGSYGRTV